jgi:3-methyladenine DNA glycosylase AlkD
MAKSPNVAAVDALAREITAAVRALPRRDTAAVRAVRRDYSRRLANEPPAYIFDLARRLLDESDPLFRWFAYELVHFHRATLRALRAKHLAQLGRGLGRWEDVDTFAPYLAGPAWREGQVSDALIQRWARSKDRWWRRAALVSTVALNNQARGGGGDPARTLLICRMLVADRDDMVVKAMSWALRALAVRDARAVRAFLTEHESGLAARVKREVNNKLTTGLKNPRGAGRGRA